MKALGLFLILIVAGQAGAETSPLQSPLPNYYVVNSVMRNMHVINEAQNAANKRRAIQEISCSDGENCGNAQGASLRPAVAEDIRASCESFLNTVKNSSDNISASHVNAPDAYGSGSDPLVRAILRGFNTTLNHIESCDRDGGCQGDHSSDPQRFCEDQLRIAAYTDVDDVGAMAENGIVAYVNEQAWNIARSPVGHESLHSNIFVNQQPSCPSGDDNCFYLKEQEGLEDDCDLLDCTMAGGGAVADQDFVSLFNHMASRGAGFSAAGTESFCSNCLGRVYEQTPASGENIPFEEAKNSLEAKTEDILAAKATSGKVMDWIGHLETMKNIAYLHEDDEDGDGHGLEHVSCEQELRPFLIETDNNPCQGKLTAERFKRRQKVALENAGLLDGNSLKPMNSISMLMRKIDQEIEPKNGNANSCRKAFAFKQRMTLNHHKNSKIKDTLSFALKALENDNYASKILTPENCSGNGTDRPFVDVYIDSLTENFHQKLVDEIESENGNVQRAKDNFCAENPYYALLICGVKNREFMEEKGLSQEAAKFFQKAASAFKEVLEAKPSHSNAGPLSAAHNFLTDRARLATGLAKSKSILRGYLKNLFYVPMKMNPSYQMAFGSWKNVCDLASRAKEGEKSLLEVLESQADEEDHDDIKRYAQGACGRIKKEMESAICGSFPMDPSEARAEGALPYSALDLTKAKADALTDVETEREQVAANAFQCDVNRRMRIPGLFSHESVGEPGSGVPARQSDYEQALAAERQRRSGEGSPYEPEFQSFMKDYPTCPVEYFKYADAVYRGEVKDHMPKEALEQEEQNRTVVGKNERDEEVGEISSRLTNVFRTADEEVVKEKSRAYSSRSGVDDKEGVVTENLEVAGTTNDFQPTASRGIASVDAEVGTNSGQGVASGGGTATGPEDGDDQEPSRFQNLFGYMNEGSQAASSETSESSQPIFSPGSDYERNAFSDQDGEACEGECLEEIASKDAGSIDPVEAAEKVGLQGYSGGTEDLKQMFNDVLDGKLNNRELERLQEENRKLQEEMASIRKALEDKNSAPKVIDSNGVDRAESVRRPASNDNVVFNPRSETPEFRSRSYFEDKKEQFNPGFDNSSGGERVSLGNYSSQRRAAATRISSERVRSINSDADRSFLQARSNATVDDNYVKQYVDHIGKEAGSIEHLIVYENGKPAKIRVPDPESPGNYLEQPIDEELAEEILEKVEKDEMESYALFNMVNFGQSLDDFMQALASEESDLTTLSSLNARLVEMRSLEN